MLGFFPGSLELAGDEIQSGFRLMNRDERSRIPDSIAPAARRG
jgi:hypothetical protein